MQETLEQLLGYLRGVWRRRWLALIVAWVVTVVGEAAKPQTLNYRENMSLIDVMITVGGITDFAAGNKATVLRVTDGKAQQFGVRLEDLVKAGDISANVEMQPGDVLIIPESWF
ncbi:MAG: SLBB domain-containing protein [Thiobacillaceae bacterium]|nr:SLBB domain-containing protein [Thiobacillaceae bacterium]